MSGEIELIPGRELAEEEILTAQKLNDLGRPTLRLEEAAITSRELANKSIGEDKLDVNLETLFGLQDGSVTTSKIADKNVTNNKLEEDVTLKNPLFTSEGGGLYRPRGTPSWIWTQTYPTPNVWQQIAILSIPAGLLARNGDTLRTTYLVRAVTGGAGKYIRHQIHGPAGGIDLWSGDNMTGPVTFTSTTWVMRLSATYLHCITFALSTVYPVPGGVIGYGVDTSGLINLSCAVYAPEALGWYFDYGNVEFLPAPA